MVDLAGSVRKVDNAAIVVANLVGVDAASDRSARVDLLLHGFNALHRAVLCDGGVWELVESGAESAHVGEGRAGTASVGRLAGVIALRAVALLGLCRARDVRHARFVRDESLLLDELEERNVVSAVARARHRLGAAVEHLLDGEVDVDTAALASDLDTVCERASRAVRPARSAVCRQVLVAHFCQIVATVHVAPVEGRRQLAGVHVRVRVLKRSRARFRVQLDVPKPLRRLRCSVARYESCNNACQKLHLDDHKNLTLKLSSLLAFLRSYLGSSYCCCCCGGSWLLLLLLL
mmetsp:Transcript_4105/g.6263  ORF Transcript_4105/g.6263 Transcript_4105/m.6263 type:complete len:291 (-) Transcript_4105:30-902(-)